MDPKRRQKALAKKAAKRKQKAKALRRRGGSGSVAETLGRGPIHRCLVPSELFERGIGNVLVSRRLPHGDVATAGFLVDCWCLGVKDALCRIDSRSGYEALVEHLSQEETLEEVEAAYAKKLVGDAVAYARELGFSPHPDYREAARAFEGIEASECREVFSFGREGKPWFVSGPNDSPTRCRRIVETLQKKLGPDGFHFIVGADDPSKFREMGFGGEQLEAKDSTERSTRSGLHF